MARIPSLTDNSQISTRVQADPTLSPDAAGQANRQNAAIASQASQGLMQLYQRQAKEAERVTYTKKSIEATKGANDEIRVLDEQFIGSDYTGYADEGIKRLRKRNEQMINEAPAGIKQQLSLDLERNLLRHEQKFRATEAQRKSEYAIFETSDQIKLAGQDSYNKWDPMESAEKTAMVRSQVMSSSLYDERARRAIDKQLSNVNQDMIQGVYDRGNIGEMSQAVADLKDEDMSVLFSDMDIKDKARGIAKLERRIEAKKSESVSNTNRDFKELNISLRSNTLNISDPAVRAASEDLKNKVKTVMEPEDADRMIKEIELNEVTNRLVNENPFNIFTLDTEIASKVLTEDTEDLIDRGFEKAKAKAVLDDVKSKMMDEFKKSPSDFVVKYDREIAEKAMGLLSEDASPKDYKEYIGSVDAIYDRMGLEKKDRKYLPSGLVKHYGGNTQQFIDAGDYKSASVLLEDFKNKTGEDIYKVYDELGIDKKVGITLEIDDFQERSNVIKNLMTAKKGIEPEFKLGFEESNNDIKQELAKDDFFKAMLAMDGGQGSFTKENGMALMDVAVVEYKASRVNGANEDDAKKAAFKAFNKNYEVIDNGAYPIPVRKIPGNDPKKIEEFIDFYKGDVDYVGKLGLNNLKTPSGVDLPADTTNENIAERGKWVYNKKSDSLMLLMRDESGILSKVTKKGTNEVFSISLKEAAIQGEEEVKQARKQAFLKRNFGRVSPHRIMR
jgi:hypothetical protein